LIDAAIIFAPLGSLVLDALRASRKGGTVALAGIVMSPVPPMDYNLIYHERVVRSVANSTRQDARELLELAAKVPVRTEVHTFNLEQANEALLALKQSRIDGAGVLQIA
jgi:propanol-preferring alcohol dehydrogenase